METSHKLQVVNEKIIMSGIKLSFFKVLQISSLECYFLNFSIL